MDRLSKEDQQWIKIRERKQRDVAEAPRPEAAARRAVETDNEKLRAEVCAAPPRPVGHAGQQPARLFFCSGPEGRLEPPSQLAAAREAADGAGGDARRVALQDFLDALARTRGLALGHCCLVLVLVGFGFPGRKFCVVVKASCFCVSSVNSFLSKS